MKDIAHRIFRESVEAIDIRGSLTRKFARQNSYLQLGERTLDLRAFKEIIAIAFGKAAFSMAAGLSDILAPDHRPEGILVVPSAPPGQLPGWKMYIGGHPVPDAGSLVAGRAILERLARCDERSFVIFLISGGGSSLVEYPVNPAVTLDDLQRLHLALITSGASIQEINTIRRHVSATKGGRLAAAAPRSLKWTLAISDVPQGHESALASGPTIPDPTTIEDAVRIAREYDLLEQFPVLLAAAFNERTLQETPKDGNPVFLHAQFDLLLSSHDLLHAAHRLCEAEGYLCVCDGSTDGWPVERAADHLLAQLAEQKKASPDRPVGLLADGELSSPVRGNGQGGRNSAFVLSCVSKIAGKPITVLSAGTDGIDGNSPAAGAVADSETFARAHAAGLDADDFIRRSDAYHFFRLLGDAIVTGPTGNNLRDLRILLAG